MYQEHWTAFQDLCWDAIQTLRDNEATICAAWEGAFLGMSLTDKTLAETKSLSTKLRITRAGFDKAIDSRWNQNQTFVKNLLMKLK